MGILNPMFSCYRCPAGRPVLLRLRVHLRRGGEDGAASDGRSDADAQRDAGQRDRHVALSAHPDAESVHGVRGVEGQHSPGHSVSTAQGSCFGLEETAQGTLLGSVTFVLL